MEKDINIKWIEDFAPINPEAIEHDIKTFISALQEKPYIYFESYRVVFRYKNMVSKIVEAINNALKIELKEWQINYIFFDYPIPREVKSMRCTGVTFTNALKLCLSQGRPILLNYEAMSQSEIIKLAKYLDDDCDSNERIRLFFNVTRSIYRSLQSHSHYIPLRDIRFERFNYGEKYVR